MGERKAQFLDAGRLLLLPGRLPYLWETATGRVRRIGGGWVSES